jgi:prevent-host-death family protein
MQVAIADAKAQFAELIRRAEAGEEITVTRHGRPVARIIAAPPGPRIALIGAMQGQFRVPDDFDDMAAEEIRAMFEGDAAGS